MRYYKYLYVSEKIAKKKETIIRKLEQGKYSPGICLILLPKYGTNQLEIVNSMYFFQPSYPREDNLVVGIVKNYGEALELVEKISQEVYDNTGEVKIRDYIKLKEQEG